MPARPADASCGAALEVRLTADGSFSLWSAAFGEGFHSAEGAVLEAVQKYVRPAALERFPPGRELRVLDVGVGLGTNSAAMLEAALARDHRLRWAGLEIDPRPLALALSDARFRRQWQPRTLELLEQLHRHGHWSGTSGAGRILWGEARQRIGELTAEFPGSWDLVLLDAFSPRRCPQLWTVEFLGQLARLLAPDGRLLTYCSAAAVRRGLQLAGLELMAIRDDELPAQTAPTALLAMPVDERPWSLGTAASPSALQPSPWLRPFSPRERDHLRTRAAEPYRDPTGQASAREILERRLQAQMASSAEPASAWRRRWGR